MTDISIHRLNSPQCTRVERGTWHIHLSPTISGVNISVENPELLISPYGNYAGIRPQTVGIQDSWWRRMRQTARPLVERIDIEVDDIRDRIDRYLGLPLTEEEATDKGLSESAVGRVLGETSVDR